jgi:peptidoglycan/LPS O-acetylase OafA/YrhL
MKYDPALDGIRALSVAAVVVHHAYYSLMPGGWVGVDVFFVLSGFLITSILRTEQASMGNIDLARFYLRRSLRLMPPLISLIAAALFISLFQTNRLHEVAVASFYAITYTMNWNKAFGWGYDYGLLHTWSLSVEEQFYIIWPAFLIISPRSRQLPIIFSIIAIVIAWRTYLVLSGAGSARTYTGFDVHADGLLIGSVLAFVLEGKSQRLNNSIFLWAGPIILAGTLLFVSGSSTWVRTIGFTIISLSAAGLIILARREGNLRAILMCRPLVFIGKISYGIYLWHYLLIIVAKPHISPQLMWIPALLSVAVATVSYYLMERPLSRMKEAWPAFSERRVKPLD